MRLALLSDAAWRYFSQHYLLEQQGALLISNPCRAILVRSVTAAGIAACRLSTRRGIARVCP